MPRSTWFKALLLFVALWAPLSQAETGWQPIQETIRKSDKDNRQYQAIRLDNGMVVLLVSDYFEENQSLEEEEEELKPENMMEYLRQKKRFFMKQIISE